MVVWSPPKLKEHSVRFYFMVTIFALLIIFIALFSIFIYLEARDEILQKNLLLQQQTEENLISSVIMLDKGLRLFDATFDYQLERLFDDFLQEYNRSGGNPENIDLHVLKGRIKAKSSIAGEIDLAIINETGIVEYSTFEEDIGLDFKQWPEAWALANQVRLGNNFSADRSVGGAAKKLRKFAYMPTPDHRYILQFGLISDAFMEKNREFSFMKVAAACEANNPDLKSVRFFDSMGRFAGSSDYYWAETGVYLPEYTPNPSEADTVLRVLEQQIPIEIVDAGNETTTRYLYIDLFSEEYVSGPQMSIVAQLTYSTSSLNHDLQELRTLHTFITVFALAVGVLFAFFTSRFITRPMTDIVDDVERIAGGDLDHTIRGGKGTEFQRLRGSINTMVGTLKGNLTTIRDSEAKIKCYSENLEKMVNKRTAQLQKSHEEMELYLDILTHKVNLSNTAITSYLHLLLQKLKSDQKRLAERALAGAEENAETIRNVEIIRRMYEEHLPTKEMDLDSVIAATASKYPEWTIRTTGTGASVLADDLLPDVFANLIGNSVKFGGPEVEIWISAEDRDDEVIVSVEDNGPGIPDDIKRTVFESFAPGRGHVAGKGLGLHIVRSIIEWYGGKVWADDRVTGKPEAGAAIRFTLKKIR
jgi:two-component system sensor histidine kinase BarA